MSFVGSNILAGASGQGGAGGYEIERSLRFNSGDSAYLNRTPSSTGNRKTWTWSGWVKFANIDKNDQALFSADDGSKYAEFRFMGDDPTASRSYKLCFQMYDGGTITDIYTERFIRDPAAWYHLVLSVDFTKSAAAERVKIYVNSELTNQVDAGGTGSATIAAQNTDTLVNLSGVVNSIGRIPTYSEYLDAYLADVHFIDGQALAATDFGETDDNGVWQPKKFNGSYNYTPTITYPAVYTSSTGVYGTVAGINSSSGVFSSTSNTGSGSIKVEFSPAISNVTHIKFNGGGYSVNAVFDIKVNGTVTHSGLTTNSSYAVRTETISSTNITSFEIVSASDGWALGNLQFSTNGSTFASPTGTPAVFAPGVNGFHLDFADNSSNAALGTDTSGNSNTWTVNNLSVGAGIADSSTVWTSGDSEWTIASGGGSASMSAAGYADVFSGLLQTNKVYGFTTYWTGGDTNGGWFICDSNSTSLSGSHPNEGRGTNSIGQRGGTASLGTIGSFSTANGVADGSGSITGFSDTNPEGTDTLTWVIDRKNHKAWVTHNGSSWVGGGNPTNTSSTPSFSLPSTGDLYFGFIQYTQMSSAVTIASYGVADPAEIDSLVDSPTNGTQTDTGAGGEVVGNYCTWNPLSTTGPTFSQANLTVTHSGSGSSGWRNIASTMAVFSGKWYAEFDTVGSQNGGLMIGIQKVPEDNDQFNPASFSNNFVGMTANSYALNCFSGAKRTNSSDASYGSGMSLNDKIMMAVDLDNGKIWWGKNGTWFASGDPDSGSNAAFTGLTGTYVFAVGISAAEKIHSNWGQRPFAYSNNISGFKSLCTANLPEPTIADGSQYFDTKLYTSNSSSLSVTGYKFSPSFVWIKNRSSAQMHGLFDVVRGANQFLSSNRTNAEHTTSGSGYGTGTFNSFDSNGFTLGDDIGQNSTNYPSGEAHVAWAWDAGSSNTTIAAGSLNSSLYDQSQTWSNNWTASGNGFGAQPPSYGFDANFDNNINNNAGGQYVTWDTTSYTLSGTLEINCWSSSGVYDVYVNGTKASDTPSSRGWINCGSFADINEIQFGGSSHDSSAGLGSAGILIYGIRVAGKTLVDSGVSVPNVPSIASTVRANPSAGFSICTYTGTNTTATVAHGLNATPGMVITKSRSAVSLTGWMVKHSSLASTTNVKLNGTDSAWTPSSNGYIGDLTSPTASHLSKAIAQWVRTLEMDPTDGPFVYTGFKVAFLLLRCTNTTEMWMLHDSE